MPVLFLSYVLFQRWLIGKSLKVRNMIGCLEFHIVLSEMLLTACTNQLFYNLRDDTHMTSHFPDPTSHCPSTSKILPSPWLWVSNFKQTSPRPFYPNDNKSIKRKHNPRMTILCYQVPPSARFRFASFRFQYQLINLVWLSFDFFLFSWSLTICLFVTLYSFLCSCLVVVHFFSTYFEINLFYLHNWKT